MEQIKEIIVTRRIHTIYCDECHKKLCESQEADDGYYANTGFKIPEIIFDRERLTPKRDKIFCKNCYEIIKSNILSKLIGIVIEKNE